MPTVETPAAQPTVRWMSQAAMTVRPGYSAGAMLAAPTSTARLKPLPPPDWLDDPGPSHECPPNPGCCLLTDDGGELTAQLAARLAEAGRTVAVLTFPPAWAGASLTLPAHVERIRLPNLLEERLAEVVDALATRYGGISMFVHLHPPPVPGAPVDPFSARDAAIVRHVFLLARYLAPPLQAAALTEPARFTTVTHLDGRLGQTGDCAPLPAGLYGLVRSLSDAWPGVACRAVDLAPTIGAAEAAQIVLAELHDPSRLVLEVGYGPGGRVTLVHS